MRMMSKETSEVNSCKQQGAASGITTIGGGGVRSSSRGRKQRSMFASAADRGVNLATMQGTGDTGGGDWEQLHPWTMVIQMRCHCRLGRSR